MITKPTIYDEVEVNIILKDILADLLRRKSVFFLGELFEKRKEPTDYFSDWDNKYSAKNKEISLTIKKIRAILEQRAVVGAAKGGLNPTIIIFHLKNNYHWVDTHTFDGEIKLSPVNINIVNGNKSIS